MILDPKDRLSHLECIERVLLTLEKQTDYDMRQHIKLDALRSVDALWRDEWARQLDDICRNGT
jgi:hypothetical protein